MRILIDKIKDKIDDFKEDPMMTILWLIIWLCLIACVVSFIVCIAAACENENNKIYRGNVTSKDHRSGYWIHTEHMTQYVPERYELTISGEKNGKEVEYYFECSEETFNSYEIGDNYPKE